MCIYIERLDNLYVVEEEEVVTFGQSHEGREKGGIKDNDKVVYLDEKEMVLLAVVENGCEKDLGALDTWDPSNGQVLRECELVSATLGWCDNSWYWTPSWYRTPWSRDIYLEHITRYRHYQER
ncbi:hypothetical protein UY3_09338 [Chelonia mydas]|uniref:Uncharacterized protein n=1 Tax=Chelonia mydas TaxID=8469 RepID=M7B6C9_CHEMY|nr:hypothetical protein UY3_09338 [Chelonia mydas]